MAAEEVKGELMLEIGCEELPARFVDPALEELKAIAARSLKALRLDAGEIETAGTPRRLALCVKDVSARQPELVREVTGPAKAVAFNADGTLSKAGLGFARSQGASPEDIVVKALPKGEYVSVVRREEGRDAATVLAEELPRWIETLRFPKSMRWGEKEMRFARPIHWIVALFDGAVIPFDVEGISAANISYGHRFMSPGSFTVSGWGDYLTGTESASVLVSVASRRERIAEQIKRAAAEEKGSVSEDDELLGTVTHLVEYPVAVCGSFEEEYLELPDEVLITSMKNHQKYFTVRDEAGRLMPRFIAVSNMKADDMTLIRAGNERVLRARLADAAFFFKEDRKKKIDELVPELEKVVYQEKIGSYREKVDRIAGLCRFLAEGASVDADDAARSALLCKTDLLTNMVGEFPELQGVMGREYALHSGEKEDVARAIYEQYLPRFAGDSLPESDPGAVLSIADRMDSIAGIFGIGKAPTGSEDPYALRRHTIAVIHILTEKAYNVSLSDLVGKAVRGLEGIVSVPEEKLVDEIVEFFRGRLENLYAAAGMPPDVVRSVLAAGFDNLPDVKERIEALEAFRRNEDFLPLAEAFKRAANIVPEAFEGAVDPAFFCEDVEKELFEAIENLKGITAALLEKKEYYAALQEMSSIRNILDGFFDQVLVMAEDPKVRENRLALVAGLASLFGSLADFRQISV